MHRFLCFAFTLCSAPVWAQSNESLLSQVEMLVTPRLAMQAAPQVATPAMQAVENGSAEVLRGSLTAMEASCTVVVRSVEAVDGGMVIILRGAGTVADVSIKLSGVAADGLELAAGTAVNIVSISTGFVLSSAGEVITFIPNELGKSLYYPA